MKAGPESLDKTQSCLSASKTQVGAADGAERFREDGCNIIASLRFGNLDVRLPRPVEARTELVQLVAELDVSVGSFVKVDPFGEIAIEAGRPDYPINVMEWGRDSIVSILGLIATGRFDLAKALLLKWARMEFYGNLPNVRGFAERWIDSMNTSDAPLWFLEAVFQYVRISGDQHILMAEARPGKTILDVCRYIHKRYSEPSAPDEIQGHSRSGLVYTPACSTWMDSLSRQGYAIEIQALWFNALRILSVLDPDHEQTYLEQAVRTKDSVAEHFWNEAEDTVYDVLCTDGGQSPQSAVPDPAVRPNQIFAVHFGLIEGERAEKIVGSTLERLLVPSDGSVQSLAKPLNFYERRAASNGRGTWKVTATVPVSQAVWPTARYQPCFPMNALFHEWLPPYHNGVAWVWLTPFLYVCSVNKGAMSQSEALNRMAVAFWRLSRDPYVQFQGEPLGGLPELTDGEAVRITVDGTHSFWYAPPKKCPRQAWSVATALWGFRSILEQNGGIV